MATFKNWETKVKQANTSSLSQLHEHCYLNLKKQTLTFVFFYQTHNLHLSELKAIKFCRPWFKCVSKDWDMSSTGAKLYIKQETCWQTTLFSVSKIVLSFLILCKETTGAYPNKLKMKSALFYCKYCNPLLQFQILGFPLAPLLTPRSLWNMYLWSNPGPISPISRITLQMTHLAS